MTKHVYISADYSEDNGDRNVVEELLNWGKDNLHKTDFIDMAAVASGSVSESKECRICDLKNEFNEQINASSTVIFIIGDKTAIRTAGSECKRGENQGISYQCTPYKQNVNGQKTCKYQCIALTSNGENVGCINSYSYLRHEFEQAKKRKKNIIVIYNSTRKETDWLPFYMREYENSAIPFWIKNAQGIKVGNYQAIKHLLGYDE